MSMLGDLERSSTNPASRWKDGGFRVGTIVGLPFVGCKDGFWRRGGIAWRGNPESRDGAYIPKLQRPAIV